MYYLIYSKKWQDITDSRITLSAEHGLQIWRPSLFRWYPSGIKAIGEKFDFILCWVLYYRLIPSFEDGYSAFLLYNEKEVLHHSVVTGRSFKYPFMGKNDLQIGMIFTQTEHRRKGLALYTGREILNRCEKSGRTIWYITEENNLASRRLAEKLGFSEFGLAIRRKIFLLGRYELLTENEKLCERVPDYSFITESPGLSATQEQVARLYQRYHFAKQFAANKDVLEIGCGAGLGLGYLAKVAKGVVGGDINIKNMNLAKSYYKDRQSITVDLMDAHNILLPDKSFDLVLLYETIYYIRNPEKCIAEAVRVLREDGILIISTVNKDWEDFHPSSYTYKYFSAPELYGLMKESFREVKLYGGFPLENRGVEGEIISLIKRSAVKFNLIPGSLKGRAYLKRIFIGRLIPLPNEVTEGMATYEPPLEIPTDKKNEGFKILYAIGKK
jgi:ubiquinone/menaquinone biosynthesis C-methylase UbiE/GNAT superfamily N-acetyltransferase